MGDTDHLLLGVVGNPVLHSRSPDMQRAALQAAGLRGEYLRIVADSFGEGLALAQAIGLHGMNVTAPFKGDAALASGGSSRGRSANTVWELQQSPPKVASTDGFGVVAALRTQMDLGPGIQAVILGAGGAAEAALAALVKEGLACTVCARSGEAASALTGRVGGRGVTLGTVDAVHALQNAQVIVSCIGDATFDLPQSSFPKGGVLLQSVYGRECALDPSARKAGMVVIPGTEWLLHQGARAFQLFTGKSPDVDVMRAALANPRPRHSHYALLGLMGAGKSTVAPLLGELLQLPSLDLDREIERREGRRITQIFQQAGEERFRDIEKRVLLDVLSGPGAVVACGGGVMVSPANRAALATRATTVWLWVAPDVAAARLAGTIDRPLLASGAPVEVLRAKLAQRTGVYAAADLVISTDGRDPSTVAQRIAREVHCAKRR